MNAQDFQRLVSKGEGKQIEFKLGSVAPVVVAKAICAFLNGRGGRLLLGVGDNREIVGVRDAEAHAERLEKELPKLISPTALWTIEQVQVNDKDVLVVDVPEGQDQPYVAEGGIYSRHGTRNVAATRDEISTLIQRRAESSQRWERQIALGVDRTDLRDNLIAETIEKAIKAQRWQGSGEDLDGFLNSLGLLVHREVTNAGFLLYGKNPTRVLPQARVRLLVLPKGKTGSVYSVDRLFEGSLLETAKQIPEALAVYTGGVESRFSENWERSDRPIYPADALREGVMNALMHRDYTLSGTTNITILSGSLEISNPGGLPNDLKPADLKKDHPSLPRNPDIAHICYLHGLIEKVGRGTQRIVEVCRAARARDPKWQSTRLATTLIFFAPGVTPQRVEELNERQQRILLEVRKGGQIYAGDVTRLVGRGVSDRTVRSDLEELVHLGLLIRRGRGRSTLYAPGKDLVHG